MIGVVLAGVLGATIIWASVWLLLRPPRVAMGDDEPSPPPSEMRTCRGCGDVYHKSWGSLCPNCSGAD